MSEAEKAREWWDNQPPPTKLAHLYEWVHSLQQDVDRLSKHVRALEDKIAALQGKPQT